MAKLRELSRDIKEMTVTIKVCENCKKAFLNSRNAPNMFSYCPTCSKSTLEKSIDDNKYLDYEVQR